MKNIFIILSFVLLSACGDDLSGLPDPDAKAPEIEPDSFSFSTATEVDADEDVSLFSQVVAGQTRYYYFAIPYYNAGNNAYDLEKLILVASDDTLELAWYDAEQTFQNSGTTELDFTVIDSSFPSHKVNYTDYYKIYFTVKNDTEFEVSYQLGFSEIPN